MLDSSVAEAMTRLTLKLLEKVRPGAIMFPTTCRRSTDLEGTSGALSVSSCCQGKTPSPAFQP